MEVHVVQRAPRRLPQLVLGERVGAALGHEVAIVSVDDLGNDPPVRIGSLHPFDDRAPRRRPGSERGVQSPAVDAAAQPVGHDVHDVVGDRRVGEIQLDQVEVPLEGDGVSVVPLEPVAFLGLGAGPEGALHDSVVAADVVEHAVQADSDATFLGVAHQVIEVRVVAEAWVDAKVVQGVITVGGGGKDWREHEAVTSQLDEVAEPVRQVPEAVIRLAFWAIFGTLFCSHETQGIAVPPDDRIEPIHPCVLPRSRRPSRMSSDATWVPFRTPASPRWATTRVCRHRLHPTSGNECLLAVPVARDGGSAG